MGNGKCDFRAEEKLKKITANTHSTNRDGSVHIVQTGKRNAVQCAAIN